MIVKDLITKINKFFQQLRSLPYEKRNYLLQVSLVVVALLLLIGWFGILKYHLSENSPITKETENVQPAKSITKWGIFKQGAYLAYQEHVLPLFSKIGYVLSNIFSLAVQLVIKIFNVGSYALERLFSQYKAYAQLIHYIFVR